MASTREIKRRIKSVKSTAQITKAMQMVAASKMKKAQERAIAATPYAQGLYDIVNKIGSIDNYSSPFLKSAKEINKVALIVIAPSRGFAGSLPSTLLLKTSELIAGLRSKNKDVEIRGIGIHKLGLKTLVKLKVEMDFQFADFFEKPSTTNLTAIYQVVKENFMKGEYDEVYMVYTHFINTALQKPEVKKILPLSLEEIVEEACASDHLENKEKQVRKSDNYIFEPSTKQVLDRLLPEYFEMQIFSALLESIASEHSARMVAMKKATDNAGEMVGNLTLKYNKTRQAGITQEMVEIAVSTMS
ncbi:ATP synthase F1 subunit gamma [Candidatus Dojkabacteria bacterium]|nr:ATP synthase F1 subunit gamma [Candidatus Dojkabacteria bacterium]